MLKIISLYQLSSKLTVANSLDDIYDTIVDALRKILKLNSFAILIKKGDELIAVRRYGIRKPNSPLKLNGKGITVASFKARKTIYVPDVTKDDRYVESNPDTKSELCVPLKFGNEVIGVINVESAEYDAFSEEDRRILEIFASMVAAAIKNVEYKCRLASSEKKYRSIFENAVEGIYRIDENGKVVEVNPSIEKLFGYSEEELKKMDLSRLYKDPRRREDFIKRVKRDGFVKNYEVEYVRKDGKIIIGNEFAILVKEGKKEYIDGIIHDITELKKAIRESEFYNSLLRHDIANKLQIIYGYLEIVYEEVEGETKEMVKLALNSAKSAMKLIENVRKLRKLKTKKKHEIELGKMIEEIMHEYEKEMKDKGIEAIYNGKDVVMYANDFLKEAISNIIWNAIVHSKANRIKVWMESNGDIKIFIEDDGIGIPDEIKDRLFEMGVKGEKSKGTGLGLYIAKKIVEEHGGRIEVSNAKDGGTIFKVIIPNK
ncbi:MAG: hypothetical protein DRN11_01975 [Thermoplasmata archaeon]|nr:MAG: hypothetical protein DRN11_01975 [Thermoplasmata archaeon]